MSKSKTSFADTVCSVVFLYYTIHLIYLGFTANGSIWMTISFLFVVWLIFNALNFYGLHAVFRSFAPK